MTMSRAVRQPLQRLAAGVVAMAAPDGSTLKAAKSSILAIFPALFKATSFKISHLPGAATIGEVTLQLITRPGFPARTVQELVAAVGAKIVRADTARWADFVKHSGAKAN